MHGEAKRYTAYSEGLHSRIAVRDESGELIAEVPSSGETIQTHVKPDQRPMETARRIARLLNSEAEVRAALREAFACFGPADAPEVEAFWEGEYEDAVSRERQPDSKEVRARVLARVRAALSALGEE